MSKTLTKVRKRLARHDRIRKRVSGTTGCPRLCVYRSLKNISVQLVDDSSGKVLYGLSTLSKAARDKIKSGGNVEAATLLGGIVATDLLGKGIKKIVFDRGGYIYHGRVKAFAEAAREGGMEF